MAADVIPAAGLAAAGFAAAGFASVGFGLVGVTALGLLIFGSLAAGGRCAPDADAGAFGAADADVDVVAFGAAPDFAVGGLRAAAAFEEPVPGLRGLFAAGAAASAPSSTGAGFPAEEPSLGTVSAGGRLADDVTVEAATRAGRRGARGFFAGVTGRGARPSGDTGECPFLAVAGRESVT